MSLYVSLSITVYQKYLITVGKDCDDIHVPLRVNCNNFHDHLTFHLALSSGQPFVHHLQHYQDNI